MRLTELFTCDPLEEEREESSEMQDREKVGQGGRGMGVSGPMNGKRCR